MANQLESHWQRCVCDANWLIREFGGNFFPDLSGNTLFSVIDKLKYMV